MKKNILYIALLALCAVSQSAFSQITTQGKDFYVTWGPDASDGTYQVRVVASVAATVTFTFTNTNASNSVTLAAGTVHTETISTTNVHSTTTGVSSKTLRIQSTEPVSVYAMNQQSATTDATNVLPVTNYGTDYYHISYRPLGPNNSDGYAAIAATNGTIVYEGGAQVATLNAGQAYHRYYAGNADGTGAHITSSAPIALFVVNVGPQIPYGTAYVDRLYQQMVPVNSWGNNFLVPVTAQGRGRIRIMASQNGTVITQSGGEIKTGLGVASLNLNAGQFVELEDSLAGGGCFISANKPVGVAAYMVGSAYPDLSYKWGDPSLAWVPPIEQIVEGTIIAPFAGYGSTQLDQHYGLVVTSTTTRAQTTVAVGAGAPTALSGGAWITGAGAAGSAYSFYSMPLSNITASYRFSNPEGLTVMGYGMGQHESYFYLSGAAGRSLNPAFYINEIHYQDIDGNVVCGQTSFHARGIAQFQVSTAP
ncbi:MAG: IgGFc-binding protein, partial [Tannerellaceae bacterium]|nr:IgGFc-binding protein [Tannerellaceae bacterium]